jgi:hypothetical protein
MATWKKVVVSGSQAHLTAVTASTAILVGTNQQITTAQSTTFLTGSFTGSFKGDGSNLTGVTATFPSTQLTPILGTTQVFVNDGANKYATVSQFSSASWAGVSGDILINGSGVATIQPDSVALGTDTTGNYVASVANSTGITTIAAASEGAAVTVSVSGASALSTNTVTKWTGTAFANSTITDDGSTVIIGGNLQVNGTTTTVSSSNLLVTDKFILLSSGSTSAADGGIIIQTSAAGTGESLFYDGGISRWSVAPGVASGDTTATPNSWLVSVSASAGTPSGNPTYGGTSGYGNMFVNTSDESIWIWS